MSGIKGKSGVYPRTKEHLEKMRINWFKKGHKDLVGKKARRKAGEKISITSKGKSMKHSGSFQPGEKHWNWKGGRSRDKHSLKDKQYKEWRLNVFKRDNFSCLGCGQVGGDLEAHHIKSWANYPNLRYIINNGVTLCKVCHKKTDSYSKKI